jgi:signal transduction histidine kinase
VSTPLSLRGAAFERAFPFHLLLDAQLSITAMGRSLHKALPGLQAGQSLAAVFDVRRPALAATRDDWLRHGTDLCTVSTRPPARALTLRGSAEMLDDGSILLLLTPVLTSLEALRALGLGFEDFARHDGVGEMLLLARTAQTSVADSLRMSERLRRRTAVLDGILELSANGVLAFDAEHKLQHANSAVQKLLGLPREQLVRRSVAEVQALMAGCLPPAEREGFDLAALCQDGRRLLHLSAPRPCVLELRGCRAPDGGSTLYLRDMTREFEVDRMKSEFLTTAAHELRTPMVSVFGFTELLLKRPVPEARRRDVLETIHRQASLLITMINDLLDLARIEARQGRDLQPGRVPVAELVRDTVERIHGAAGAHTLHVALDPAHAEEALHVDVAKTSQALTNVLSNAFKYAPPGTRVEVSSRLDGAHLGLVVSDQGIGMTPEQLARVCERFYRADPSGNIPGTGLGMSLVKEIVEQQDGRIEITSEHGRGTRVVLWLPRATAPKPAPVPVGVPA